MGRKGGERSGRKEWRKVKGNVMLLWQRERERERDREREREREREKKKITR